jgi:hypothetical protein
MQDIQERGVIIIYQLTSIQTQSKRFLSSLSDYVYNGIKTNVTNSYIY